MSVIDAHQHFWDLDEVDYPWLTEELGPIFRTFAPDELRPQLEAAGVDGTVLVQSANSREDTESMLRIAAAHPWVHGVVGWVPLEDPGGARDALDAHADPMLCGIRHLIHIEPDPDWVVADRIAPGLDLLAERDLAFDVVAVSDRHLSHVPALARRHPSLRLVIDHLAKPPIAEGRLEPWRASLAAAAAHPNVYAKISGLNTAASADWDADELRPYVHVALELFGAERLMFGSDWPVATLAGDYAQVIAATRAILEELSGSEQRRILGGTAQDAYRLGARRAAHA